MSTARSEASLLSWYYIQKYNFREQKIRFLISSVNATSFAFAPRKNYSYRNGFTSSGASLSVPSFVVNNDPSRLRTRLKKGERNPLFLLKA